MPYELQVMKRGYWQGKYSSCSIGYLKNVNSNRYRGKGRIIDVYTGQEF